MMSNDFHTKRINTNRSRIRYTSEPSYTLEASLDEEWERQKNQHPKHVRISNPAHAISQNYKSKTNAQT